MDAAEFRVQAEKLRLAGAILHEVDLDALDTYASSALSNLSLFGNDPVQIIGRFKLDGLMVVTKAARPHQAAFRDHLLGGS